jgi:hypothetical protein
VVDPFWGATTPAAIAALPRAIASSGKDQLRAALTAAVEHLSGSGSAETDEAPDVDAVLLGGSIAVVAAAVRASADEEAIMRDMGGLGMEDVHAQDFAKAVRRGREMVSLRGSELGRGFPTVEDVRWRVDVTISTTHLSRVLKPSVLMQLTLSDGSIRKIEVDADKLQQLRFHVASAISSMQSLRLDTITQGPRARSAAAPKHVGDGIAKNASAVAAALGAAPVRAGAPPQGGGGVPHLPGF